MRRYVIRFAPQTLAEWGAIDPRFRQHVAPGARTRLSTHPARPDRHWIARLSDLAGPAYRLRVGPLRIFYDVRGSEVWVLCVAMLPRVDPPGALRRCNDGTRASGPRLLPSIGGRTVRAMALTEVKKDLSQCLRQAREEPIVITGHGRAVGLLVGFASEDAWLEYRLRNEPEFFERIERARRALLAGRAAFP